MKQVVSYRLQGVADRPKDWVDGDGILIRQAGAIDWQMMRIDVPVQKFRSPRGVWKFRSIADARHPDR